MTKNQLTSQSSPDALALRQFAKEINAYNDAAEIYCQRVKRDAFEALSNYALAGNALKSAKARVHHGNWYKWLSKNCPNVTPWKSAAMMRLADNWQSNPEVQSAPSITAALAICEGQREKQKGEPQSWPPFLEAVNRFERLTKFISSHPVNQWPDEGVGQLRERVEPLARSLWPDKFK